MSRVFLLSPAHCGGERARLLFDARARFDLARRLHAGPEPTLGEIFSFMSGLYFRGKLAYARAFAAPPPGPPGLFVITTSDGLCLADEPVDLARLRRFAETDIRPGEARYEAPLLRDARPARGIARAHRRGDPARQRGHRQVRRSAARRVRSLPGVPLGLCRTRRHEPRRALAALGRRRHRARLRPGRQLGEAWRPPASIGSAHMSGSTTRKSTGPARQSRRALSADAAGKRLIPRDADTVEVRAAGRAVTLTHLRKVFWPELGLTKGDLLQFYADVAPVLLPHLAVEPW